MKTLLDILLLIPEELLGMCSPEVGELVPACKDLLAEEIFIEICY